MGQVQKKPEEQAGSIEQADNEVIASITTRDRQMRELYGARGCDVQLERLPVKEVQYIIDQGKRVIDLRE